MDDNPHDQQHETNLFDASREDRTDGEQTGTAERDEQSQVIPAVQNPGGEKPDSQQDDFPEMDQNVELDLEMNLKINKALQSVIDGFDHGPGDMSATLQQQEEYMRRNGRAPESEADMRQHQLEDREVHHDDVDELEGDRTDIFRHFAHIDADTRLSHSPRSPHSSHLHGPLDGSQYETGVGSDTTGTPNAKGSKGTKRKRPLKLKGPVPPYIDDPSRPLSEDEIKKRQARSRASGRVLPRGNACEFCKRRKLRCDGEKPVCTNCAKGGRECTYVQAPAKIGEKSKRGRHSVADLDQPLAGPTIELTPDVALPNPVELIGDVDHEPITDVLENTLDPALEPPQNDETVPGATDSFLPQNLDGLELPSIDITGTEHHDGFNTLFEQSAAAEAEAHGHGDEGEGVAQFDEHQVGRIGEPASGIVEGAGEDKDSSQGGEGSNRASGQTGQEPYLMTLANAAEVASDVPHFDTGSLPIAPVVNRKKRSRTSSAVPEQDSVWKHIWLDLKTDLQELPEIDDETGGLLVGELLDIFYKKAEAFYYTRSLNRLHTALVSGPRPQKCLLFAILGTVAVSRINGLSPEILTLARRLGPQFLSLSQKDFLTSLRFPDRMIDAIQAAVLITQVYYTQGKITEGWLLITQALRLAVMAGLHHLKLDHDEEQVLDQVEVEGEVDPQIVSITHRRPIPTPSVIPRPTVLTPPDELTELGERVHLFWSCLMVERIGCMALGTVSSVNDEDVLTPWPRPVHEYADGSCMRSDQEFIGSFMNPSKAMEHPEDRPKDTWFTRSLKAITLLHAAQRLYDRSVSHPGLDQSVQRQRVFELIEGFKAELPEDCVQLPSVSRKRLLEREIIWVGSALHAARTLLFFAGYPIDHTAEMLESTEFIVKVSKAMSVPERPKLDSAIIVLWYLTSQHLRGIGELCWGSGKVEDSKKTQEMIDILRDRMKMLARVSPLALGYVRSLE